LNGTLAARADAVVTGGPRGLARALPGPGKFSFFFCISLLTSICHFAIDHFLARRKRATTRLFWLLKNYENP
jgi:hypothetical protein